MSTSKLSLFNNALLHLEERKLSSLSENREPRRALDDAYDVVIAYCIEQGFWKHALRTVSIESSSSIDPAFGYASAFAKPDDWVRTYQLSQNESFEPQLLRFNDEAGYWFADGDILYARYVSNDPQWGYDLSRWPASFAEYVSLRLAVRTCKRITGNDTALDKLEPREKKALGVARANDAMNGAPVFPPVGTWAASRSRGWSNRSRWNGQIA